MGISINTNVGALSASAASAAINKSMETSMERLSTGKRINTAADDAAGVAIASRLTSEIRGTNQAIRNAMDGQALLDTAEGAHAEVEFILQRMRELSIQAANDTNNASDRANLQTEMTALTQEIDRIAGSTTWAGKKLLDGATPNSADLASSHGDRATFGFQVGSGTSSRDSITAAIGAISSAALGVGGATSRPTIGNVTDTATAGAASYDATTGALTITGAWANTETLSLNVNGTAVTLTVSSADKYADSVKGVSEQLKDQIDALNLQGVNVTATDTGITFNAGAAAVAPVVKITSAGTNAAGTITHTAGANKFTLGGSFSNGDTYSVSALGKTISITASTTDSYADTIDGLGQQLAEAINAAQDSDGTVGTNEINRGLSASYNASTNEITLTQAAVIADPQASVTASKITFSAGTPGTVTFVDGLTAGDTISMTVNGVDLPLNLSSGTAPGYDVTKGAGVAAYMAAKINEAQSTYGVSASSTSAGVVTLTALTGLALAGNAQTSSAGTAQLTQSGTTTTFSVTGTAAVGDTFSLDIDGTTVSVTIATDGYAEDNKGVASQIAQAVKDANINGVIVTDNTDGTFKLEKTGSLDLSTTENARLSVEFIDSALQTVNTQRANLGAISNRLDSTVKNLTNIVTNLQAGRGRIEDADFAAETTNLAKSQILQQASMAMLAQANASKQGVLSLLQR